MLKEREEREKAEAQRRTGQYRRAKMVPNIATVESDSDDSSASSIRVVGDLAKMKSSKRPAKARPSYEFFITDDPHVP